MRHPTFSRVPEFHPRLVPRRHRPAGGLGKSKLKQFTLVRPYPTPKGDQATLAKFLGGFGLYDSASSFSWKPRRGGAALTWGSVTTFNLFANMQALNLNVPCGLATPNFVTNRLSNYPGGCLA